MSVSATQECCTTQVTLGHSTGHSPTVNERSKRRREPRQCLNYQMDVHHSYSSLPYLLPQILVLKNPTHAEVCRGSAKAEDGNIGKNSSLITIYGIKYLQTFIIIMGIIKLFGNKEQSDRNNY